MATIPFSKLEDVLEKSRQPQWHWVADDPDEWIVYASKDQPPTATPGGHWEYVPTLGEIIQEAAPFYNSFPENDYHAPNKGWRIAKPRS